MADDITYELFTRRFDQLNEMHRELRQDMRHMADTLVQLSRQITNLDRRMSDVDQRGATIDRRLTEVKEELEGTIKMEIGGAISHLKTRLETYIDRRIADRGQPQFSED